MDKPLNSRKAYEPKKRENVGSKSPFFQRKESKQKEKYNENHWKPMTNHLRKDNIRIMKRGDRFGLDEPLDAPKKSNDARLKETTQEHDQTFDQFVNIETSLDNDTPTLDEDHSNSSNITENIEEPDEKPSDQPQTNDNVDHLPLLNACDNNRIVVAQQDNSLEIETSSVINLDDRVETIENNLAISQEVVQSRREDEISKQDEN